jgi:hypothetical protein
MIDLDGQRYSPLAFRSFRPTDENISDFYQAGVRLMSILMTGLNCTLDVPYSPHGEIWTGLRQYDWSAIDRQMALFQKNAPDARFNIMLQLDTRDWYLKANPECSNTFYNLVEMAGYEKWRQDVLFYLTDVIAYLETHYGDCIFAYSLFCGSSTEWYTNSLGSLSAEALIRRHPLKQEAYRRYCGDAAAELPSTEQLHHLSHGVFRDPQADREALAYWHFHHQAIGSAILYFAAAVKAMTARKKLLGLFYGYLLELTGGRLLQEGHLGYEPVWRSPDIDMIFEPASYGATRLFGGVSGFLHTVDSVDLRNKLTFHEVDHTTYIAPQKLENGRKIPGSDSKLPDSFSTRMVLRREFVMSRVKQTGLWWFDFFGGYYRSPELMAEIGKMVAIDRQLSELDRQDVAEIAMFGDTESMYHVSATDRINDDCLRKMRDNMGRIGAPYDSFTFSDLPDVDLTHYRLCIFLNTFRIGERERAAIENRVKKDGRSILWLYAPDYLTDGCIAVDSISRMTGMTVRPADVTDSEVISGDSRYRFSGDIQPLFQVSDEAALATGYYAASQAVALARKDLPGWTSWYSAVGNVPSRVLRDIARQSGVHLYHDGDDPVYVNNRLIGIHAVHGGLITLNLPGEETLEDLFDGGSHATKGCRVQIRIPEGEMKLYLRKR